MDEVEDYLREAVVVCHNAQFDLQFLDSEFRRLGREIQVTNLIDTLFIVREHFDFASNSLTNIAAEFGIQNPEAHRALAFYKRLGFYRIPSYNGDEDEISLEIRLERA